MEIHSKELNGIKFDYYENDLMSSYSIADNIEWEPHITHFVKKYKNIYGIQNIIDVGANLGYHSILFSKEVSGKVFAFEPQIQNYSLLQKNLEQNNITNVVTYNLGCGDENCDIKMPIIEDNINWVNMGDITPNWAISDKYSVTKSILLDEMNFNEKIDLIKIDVQGWEKKVLTGLKNIMQTEKPILIVEFEWFQLSKAGVTCEELFDYIRSNNYYIFYLDYQYPSDHVCVHNDNLADFRFKFADCILPHTENNDVNRNINCGITEKIVMRQ